MKTFEELAAVSKRWWETATEDEKEAMLAAQRKSWLRGEMGMGSDKDEAEYRIALQNNDRAALKRLDREARERVDKVK